MLYINKFIDRLQQLEMKGNKDFICPLQDAKMLHSDITKLLLALEQMREQSPQEEVIEINVAGGSFK